MTTYVFSPEGMRKFVTKLESEGIKVFVFSSGLNGIVAAPTKKTRFFKIPSIIPKNLFKKEDVGNLIFKGTIGAFYFSDSVDHLSEEAIAALSEPVEETA